MQLTPSTTDLVDPRVRRPAYDRTALVPAVVHIGVGGFHRAHLAVYLDDLAAAGEPGWGILGGGVLDRDAVMADALAAQDGLYTLVVRGADEVEVRVIGSLLGFVHAADDLGPLVDRIADPTTRIVSLTVTEGGYPVDDETGAFDPTDPDAGPTSAFAAIVRGLRRRHDEGTGPVTVLSCDNVIGNGDVARTATLGVAGELDPVLCDWIATEVTFPNSMVDRITPQTTDRDRAWLATEYGLEDRWPVVTEPFIQWVVEDRFAAGRPPLDQLGVIVTDDVEPYERWKLRLLNASHSSLAYLARLLDIERVDEVMADHHFDRFVRRFLAVEAGPLLPPVPGMELTAYQESLVERFANPAIGDQVERLCLDGSAKFPKFLLPTVRGQLATGGPIAASVLALAGWCRYLEGTTEDGRPLIPAPDPHLDEAQHYAAASRGDAADFLAFRAVFGDDLPRDERFVTAFTEALGQLRERGVRASIDAALAVQEDPARG